MVVVSLLINLRSYSDLGGVDSNSARTRETIAEQVRDACLNVGFFYGEHDVELHPSDLSAPCPVKNHGIPDEVIENVYLAAQHFFSLPLEEKSKVIICSYRSRDKAKL